ncbi:prepilin-type N-terminal cleavage/methylation domain-containing protein [Patescibacteria group bacterium]|nr:prepilin-type N-terminal cleavage/methylation domain-containing protein [Patescibacteria group bacterium]
MNKGFTLFELIITIGVTVIISSLVLTNFPRFSRTLGLSRTAQAIALSFREAEGAALGVREFGSGIFPGYGLHFDLNEPKSYILFADINDDRVYDPALEKVDTFIITGSPSIVDLCADVCGYSSLDIVFVRPAPDVIIRIGGIDFSSAKIIIELPTGERKHVVIRSTGQLSIETP